MDAARTAPVTSFHNISQPVLTWYMEQAGAFPDLLVPCVLCIRVVCNCASGPLDSLDSCFSPSNCFRGWHVVVHSTMYDHLTCSHLHRPYAGCLWRLKALS
jgi:hypothetical protein